MINPIFAQADQGGYESSHVARIAYMDCGFTLRNFAVLSRYGDSKCGFVGFDGESQGTQGSDHNLGIATEQRSTKCDRVVTERAENQGPVSDAF